MNLKEFIIIAQEEWLKDVLQVKLVKLDNKFQQISLKTLILKDNDSIQELFTYFKDEYVLGYNYITMDYLLKYLDTNNIKDYSFTYLDLKELSAFNNKVTKDLSKLVIANKDNLVLPDQSSVFYHPTYERFNKPFLRESLSVRYQNTVLYITYEGDKRKLHNIINRYNIHNEEISLKDLLYIKKMGAKIHILLTDFSLNLAEYIDTIYINDEKNLSINQSKFLDLYKLVLQKEKYNIEIHYDSLRKCATLFYNYDLPKAKVIMSYLKEHGEKHYPESNKNLTVISSKPLNGRMELIYNMIYYQGLLKQKSIQIFNYDGNNNWFTENLIASISNIDHHQVEAFFNPCEVVGKLYKDYQNLSSLNHVIEQLQDRDIIMVDFTKQTISCDYLDYLLDYNKDIASKTRNIYIINTLEALLKKTNYSKELTIKKLSNFAKTNNIQIVLITNVKNIPTKELELSNILEYRTLRKYTKRYFLTKRKSKNELLVLEHNTENGLTLTKTHEVNYDSHHLKEDIEWK